MPNSPQQDLKSILFMQSSLALSISDKINQMKQPRLYPLFWMIRTVQGGLFDHLHQWSWNKIHSQAEILTFPAFEALGIHPDDESSTGLSVPPSSAEDDDN